MSCLLVVLAAGCTDDAGDAPAEAAVESPRHAGEMAVFDTSPVLVRVNGESVTELDVELTINRTFDQAELVLLNDEVRSKTIESLVASKAIRTLAEKTLSSDDLGLLRKKAQAYEEELIVKAYLDQEVTPTPVTSAMVEQYYQENPELFGAHVAQTYELLVSDTGQSEAQRNQFLSAVAVFKNAADWSSMAANWATEYGITYRREFARPDVLDARILSTLAGLSVGDVSNPVVAGGTTYLFKVVEAHPVPPRPLAEVSGQIRKTLAPLQVRQAVKHVMNDAVSQANIDYLSK